MKGDPYCQDGTVCQYLLEEVNALCLYVKNNRRKKEEQKGLNSGP